MGHNCHHKTFCREQCRIYVSGDLHRHCDRDQNQDQPFECRQGELRASRSWAVLEAGLVPGQPGDDDDGHVVEMAIYVWCGSVAQYMTINGDDLGDLKPQTWQQWLRVLESFLLQWPDCLQFLKTLFTGLLVNIQNIARAQNCPHITSSCSCLWSLVNV